MFVKIVTLVLDLKFRMAMKDKEFLKFAESYDCAVVMKTRDNRHGRRFIFKNGTYSSDTNLDDFDAALVWKDNLSAAMALSKGTDQAVLEAVQKHKADVLGKVHYFNWFGAAMNRIMGKVRERKI